MWSICRFSQIVPLLTCVSSLSAIAAPSITEVTATFKIVNDYLIVVPVTINGSGPYDFVLDTGSNNTMLDQKLAEELALPRGGEATVMGIAGSTSVAAVNANSLSIAGAIVDGKDLCLSTVARMHALPARVRGILGEDFLQHFDVLIDYRHRIIRLESGLGQLAQTLVGERVPLQLSGTNQGGPLPGRLIVIGHIPGLGDNPISLLLDSAANNLTLFRETLGPGSIRQEFVDAGALKSSEISMVETRTFRRLNLGRSQVDDLTVVAIAGRQEQDVDGLVPLSLFHSIFISHQGRFVILNPSLPKGSQHLRAASN